MQHRALTAAHQLAHRAAHATAHAAAHTRAHAGTSKRGIVNSNKCAHCFSFKDADSWGSNARPDGSANNSRTVHYADVCSDTNAVSLAYCDWRHARSKLFPDAGSFPSPECTHGIADVSISSDLSTDISSVQGRN